MKDGHRTQVFLTILPNERRSRHPYQLCMMLALITVGVSGLLVGPPPTSAITNLPQSSQDMLNWVCIYGGLAGVAAAFIPERIIQFKIRQRQYDFDATWTRLWEELACHGLLLFVWLSYLVTILAAVPFRVGLSVGTGLVFWLGVAATWRCCQIAWTIKRAVLDPPGPAGVIGSDELSL